MEKKCAVCNKIYIPGKGSLIYCSKKCFKNRPIKKRSVITRQQAPSSFRVCEICEKEFTPHSRSQIICSKSCHDDFLKKDKIRMRVEKVYCKFCGYYFDISGTYKSFCSTECQNEFNGITRRDKVLTPKFCLNCKKSQSVYEAIKYCKDKNCDTYKSERKIKKIMNNPEIPATMGSCLYCNETFRVFFPYQKFCSAECHMLFKVRSDVYSHIIPEEI
jgi:hypothetical protein